MKTSFQIPLIASLALLAMMTGCRMQSDLEKRPRERIHHVVLITVDTLRMDAVSRYAESAPHTPTIDALADDAVIFTSAMSPASWTVPSMTSMMTGHPVAVHGTQHDDSRIPERLPTLASEMSEAGYFTAGVGWNPFLKSKRGFGKGFDSYHLPVHNWFAKTKTKIPKAGFRTKKREKRAPFNSTPAIQEYSRRWLQDHRDTEDFFLWIHYMDPHIPYAPPPRFKPTKKISHRIRSISTHRKHVIKVIDELDANNKDSIRTLYDAEVQWVDDSLGHLISHMKELGIYEEALIVLASDHGEEFFEHGGFEHGHSLHTEVVHVPLIVKLPASHTDNFIPGSAGDLAVNGKYVTGVREEMVSTQSVMATILTACGLGVPDESLRGSSLTPLLGFDEPEWEDAPLFAQGVRYGDNYESVIVGSYKLIRCPVTGDKWLYDIASDPKEASSLVDSRPDLTAELEIMLDQHITSGMKVAGSMGFAPDRALSLDPKTTEQLRMLGYLD